MGKYTTRALISLLILTLAAIGCGIKQGEDSTVSSYSSDGPTNKALAVFPVLENKFCVAYAEEGKPVEWLTDPITKAKLRSSVDRHEHFLDQSGWEGRLFVYGAIFPALVAGLDSIMQVPVAESLRRSLFLGAPIAGIFAIHAAWHRLQRANTVADLSSSKVKELKHKPFETLVSNIRLSNRDVGDQCQRLVDLSGTHE